MIKVYVVNGVEYNVSPDREEQFLKDFPTAQLLEEESVEKTEPTVETTAPAVGSRRMTQPNVGVSQQAVGSLELQRPRTTDESLNLLANKAATEELSAGEKMMNSLRNVPTMLKQAAPYITLGTDSLMAAIFGREAMDEFNNNPDIPEIFRITDKTLAADRKRIQELNEEMQARGATGEIVKGFKEGDIGEIAAGVVNGITSIGSSAAVNMLTLGGGLIPEFIGRGYMDYNETLAKEKGKSLEELIEDGEDEIDTPIGVGVLSGALERFGLKGAGKSLSNALVKQGLGKGITKTLLSGNKEGLTEFVQTGLEGYNVARAEGKTNEEALGEMTNTMFSQQGLESYLQGFVGGGVLRGKGQTFYDKQDKLKASGAIKSLENQKIIDDGLSEIEKLENKYKRTKDRQVKSSITRQKNKIKQRVSDAVLENNKILSNMSETEIYEASKISDKIEKIEKGIKEADSKYNNGTITKEERNTIVDGLKLDFEEQQTKLSDIKQSAITRADEKIDTQTETVRTNIDKLKQARKEETERLRNELNQVRDEENTSGITEETKSRKRQLRKQLRERAGKDITLQTFESSKEVGKYLKEKGEKQYKVLANTNDGVILQNSDGTQEIILNKEIARKTGAVNVAAHEFLHGILYKTLNDNPDTAINLALALGEEIGKIDINQVENSTFRKRLELYKEKPQETQAEEVIALFADAVATGDIKYNENVFQKIGNTIRQILESFGVRKKFNTGKDVFNFIKDYNADIAKGGIRQSIIRGAIEGFEGDLIVQKPKKKKTKKTKTTESKSIFDELQAIDELEANFKITPKSRARREELQKQLKDEKQKPLYDELRLIEEFESEFNITPKSRARREELQRLLRGDTQSTIKASKSVLEDINNLVPKTVKTKQDFQNPRIFNRIYESLTQRDNVINNYIRSRAESQEEADRIIDNVTERLVKFDPEQTRADGTKVGTEGFGEFIFANTRFGKLDARKDLFKEGEKRKVEDKIDKPEAKQVKEKETTDAKIDIGKSVGDIIPNLTKEFKRKLAQLGTIKAQKDLEGKKGTDKQLIKKRTKAFNDLFGKQLFNTIRDTFGKNTKTSKDFTNFLNKNYDVLSSSALNYIDFQMGGGPAANWSIENPPTRQEFIDYYEGKDIAPGKPASVKSDRKKSLINAVARDIADTERIEFAKQDPVTAGEFKKKTGIVLASKSMYAAEFEKPATNLDRQFRLYKGDVNKVLEKHVNKNIPPIESKKDIDKLITNYKTNLLPLFDYNFFFHSGADTMTIFTKSGASARELNFKRGLPEKERKEINKYYIQEIQKLRKFKNFGKPIMLDGKPITKYTAKYNTEIGENVPAIEKNIKSGKIQAFNRKWGTIHKEMWNRLDKYINSLEGDKKTNAAITVAQYMKLSASNDNHPNRLGAQFVGYSTKPVGFTTDKGKFKLIEWEHAMPQTGAYMYLLDSILDTSRNFNLDYAAVVNNFKLLALDKADDVKLTNAGYQRTMPEGWKVFQNSWLERYLNPTVALFDDGIDPTKIKLLNGKTIAETYSVNESGQLSESSVKASQSLSDDFNDILQEVKGVDSKARYSDARAAKLGKKNNPFKFFVPYSAEDYMGLIYPTLGKGKTGDKNLEWYKENIINPYAEGIKNYESAKIVALKAWEDLKSKIKNTPAKLNKEAVRDFTNEDAIRLYLWDKQKVLPEGVSKKDIKALKKHVESNPELLAFANQIQGLTIDGYPEPTGDWLAGTITTDLVNYTNTVSRKKFLEKWQENVDIVYSKENMNKLRALYGDNYVEALQDMLHRMKTGRNRPTGANKLTNQFMNWVNDSVGTIMFFNTRSALLQTISSVNYLNWSDNNPIKAAQAFANQKQYWSDFAEIFNSDFLKSRRSGLKTDVNADEIARTAETSQNKVRAALSYILKKGFLPTQMADSFAISIGGAAFYRNRINKYKQDGLSETEAKEKAFLDFKEITEESQQSSRPDRVSMQQASPLGRVILAFANTPMQYARLTKKAALDLINNRGDWKTNLSKLAYYGAVQNIIFTALQGAMFSMLFDDEEDDEKEKEKYGRVANGIADTLLRGAGVAGAAVATAKNMVVKAIDEYQSGRPNYEKVANEITTLSPPINSKLRKLQSAGRAFTYKQSLEKMREEGPLSIDNPAYMAAAQTLSAVANIPLDRALRKMENLKASVDSDTEVWQRISLMLGYNKWDLGLKDKEIEQERERKALQKYLLKSSKLRTPKYKTKSNRNIRQTGKKISTRTKRGRIGRSNLQKNLPEGVLGRANNDGTIDIKPGLPKEKRKKVIAHEKQHIKDMKSGQLNYDADYVYWKNNKYKRTNGHVIYNGKKYEDGHPKLPWEAKANKAEQKVS